MANSQYFALFLKAEIDMDLLSVGQPNRNAVSFYGNYSRAATLLVGKTSYPALTLNGSLSAEQQAMVNSEALRDLVGQIELRDDESIHFTRSDLSIYLHYRPVELLLRTLELGKVLLQRIGGDEQDDHLDQLPEAFQPLIPLIQKWSTSDDTERNSLVEDARSNELVDLVTKVSPHMNAINAHFDSFAERPLDSPAIKLAQLAEIADEARRRLESES